LLFGHLGGGVDPDRREGRDGGEIFVARLLSPRLIYQQATRTACGGSGGLGGLWDRVRWVSPNVGTPGKEVIQ
jgi:hypothetical protein